MRSGSLFGRLVRPLAVAVFTLTVLILLIGFMAIRSEVVDRARTRAYGISKSARHTIERFMRETEHRDLVGFARDVARNPDVAAVRVLRQDHRIVASSMPDEVGMPAGVHSLQHNPAGDLLSPSLRPDDPAPPAIHVVEPLLNKPACHRCHGSGQPILGFLDTDIVVPRHVTGLLTFSTLATTLGGLFLGVVVSVSTVLVRRAVGKPVEGLKAGMRRVQAGDLDVHIPPSGTNEIDDLINGFNGMVVQLRKGRDAEERARRLQLERVEQMATVGELAAGLAHEIRNPLSGVKSVVDVLADEAADNNPSLRAVLRDAAGELLRIDQIVRDLLQYARPKAPAVEPFDLNQVVTDAVALMTVRAAAEGAKVRTDLAPGLPAGIADAANVRQVLINLLLNALQAVNEPASARVDVATGLGDAVLWCRVRDNGPGIPADRAEAVFQPFVTTKAKGTGLGLSISRRVMELQGGSLSLDNPGEHGASFTITVPVAPSVAQA